MATLWKQKQPLHPLFAELQGCLHDDWFLLEHEIALQAAHATVLLEAGVIDASTHADVGAALDHLTQEWSGAPAPDSTAEDLHTWIEEQITAACPEGGRRIHTARSRNDQVATLLLLHLRSAATELDAALGTFIATAAQRAIDWSHLQMPLQTHAQFAAPGSVGAWPLRFAASLSRSQRHLRFLRGEWAHWCPLGAGAVAGSSIAIDRQRQATLLGFDEPWPSSLDATSSRDACLELLAWSTGVALQLQSLATDGQGFAQTPFGFTKYPSALATGSSMMPNKSNPDALELLRGEANAVAAAHVQAVLLLKGLPSGYQRDLQCIKPLVRAVPETLSRLLALATVYLEALEFDADHLERALEQGDIGATLRMEARVASGAALRDAHHVESDGPGAASSHLDARAYQTTGSASPHHVREAARAFLQAGEAKTP